MRAVKLLAQVKNWKDREFEGWKESQKRKFITFRSVDIVNTETIDASTVSATVSRTGTATQILHRTVRIRKLLGAATFWSAKQNGIGYVLQIKP